MKIITEHEWARMGWKARQAFLAYQSEQLLRFERLLALEAEAARVPDAEHAARVEAYLARRRAEVLLATMPAEPEGRARLKLATLEAGHSDPRRREPGIGRWAA